VSNRRRQCPPELIYNPVDGELYVDGKKQKSFNKKSIRSGYKTVCYKGCYYTIHQYAFDSQGFHRDTIRRVCILDGDKTNTVWSNLKLMTAVELQQHHFNRRKAEREKMYASAEYEAGSQKRDNQKIQLSRLKIKRKQSLEKNIRRRKCPVCKNWLRSCVCKKI